MNLTEQQKTDAAKALLAVLESWGCDFHEEDYLLLQAELAKVGLEIQPIEKKPLLKDLPTCE